MSAKSRKWDTRTIIYVLIVFLIIVAVVYFVTQPQPEAPRSVRNVLANAESLKDQVIMVEGEFDDENGPSLIPPTNAANPVASEYLPLEFTDINISNNMTVGVKYDVTGELKITTNPVTGANDYVYLIATEVDPV